MRETPGDCRKHPDASSFEAPGVERIIVLAAFATAGVLWTTAVGHFSTASRSLTKAGSAGVIAFMRIPGLPLIIIIGYQFTTHGNMRRPGFQSSNFSNRYNFK